MLLLLSYESSTKGTSEGETSCPFRPGRNWSRVTGTLNPPSGRVLWVDPASKNAVSIVSHDFQQDCYSHPLTTLHYEPNRYVPAFVVLSILSYS